jgi:filamentous hemagglutinin
MLKNGQYSDAQELQSIQRLLSSTPYAYGKDMVLPPHLKSLAGIVADLTPIVGDAKAFLDAKDPFDYALAVVGALGPLGDGAAAAIRAAKAAHQAGNAAEATRQLQNAEKIIDANVGNKGSWSTGINGRLEGHANYRLNNGHIYNTDGLGRVKSVEGDLSLTAMDRNKYQQCVTGKCGEVGDQGGHLIAATLGGAGDRINLVPQAATLNNGAWKAMENEFKAALDAGKKVTVKIEVGYPAGSGIRPSEFKVIALINGVQSVRKFTQ